jgi:heterodisulfide reductase subunit A
VSVKSEHTVCVVGAGVSGLSVANDLARAGVGVYLIEQSPYPGGRATLYGCKAAESCVHCGVCLVREAVSTLRTGTGTECLLSSRPKACRPAAAGSGGNGHRPTLEVSIETSPNPVDWKACIECGLCQQVCPEDAVHRAPGWKYYIDARCNSCGKCLEVCPVDAIQLQRSPEERTLAVNAVVMAAGFKPFDPSVNRKWGYGANPRVLTGTQMEELFRQESYLPVPAERVAFIQCVGSRNVMEGSRHCSRVCCAYALRMAGRLRQELPELAIDFYHMDIQHFGKSFEQFWGQLRPKINLIASNPISIRTDDQGKPLVRYESLPDLSCREQSYDVVILSNGVAPAEEGSALADLFGLGLDSGGFLAPAGEGSEVPALPGVFTAGACKRPMRIDDCVEDAAAVSQQVLQYLGVDR